MPLVSQASSRYRSVIVSRDRGEPHGKGSKTQQPRTQEAKIDQEKTCRYTIDRHDIALQEGMTGRPGFGRRVVHRDRRSG